MVKTRRSNGENGEVDERNDASNEVPNDAASVSEEKESNWTPRELRSSRYNRPQLPRWPANYKRRLRKIKMKRIVFPESDTDPEKYSRRSRQVRVFFTGDDDSTNRSVKIRRNRTPRKNYVEETVDSEDKPIQQNVRRSCRQRKLLHHNFNESWITNELKVRGYPGLYGIPGTSSSDEFTSGDDAPVRDRKKVSTRPPAVTDDDTQSGRQRRTSMRFNNSNKKGTESDSDVNNDQTVIEQVPGAQLKEEAMDAQGDEGEREGGRLDDAPAQDADSAPAPARATRGRGRLGKARQKKDEFSHQETASESESSESGSGLMRCGPPRRSKRTRKPTTFVEIAPRETRTRTQTFTIRKKPYSLRERKPKILRRKNIRSQSPDSSSSSGSSSDSDEDLNVSMKNKTKGRQKSRSMDDKKTDRALRDIRPIEVDGSVRFTSVGGLDEHIKCLREMVLFPLMYPEVFQKFGSRPAKGVLFHGPPGTGKTLLARALANECSVVGGRKVAFFLRKGADCLKKWVGESERHLKLLFQQANKMKPSIIFFDEVDALAPVRSARQEQVHASVVGTLLAEMDGLCDRGEVVVIGATNRLDGIDPALRRAGRFDRELYFPAPAARARRDILHICTRGWQRPPPPRALDALAAETHGYGGSDLKALCSEAVLKALRRVYPQVYESEHALLIDPNNVEVTEADFLSAMRTMVAASSRAAPPPARALPAHAAPLLHAQLQAARELLQRGVCSSSDAASPATFLLAGPCAGSHLAPALLADMEHAAVRELSLAELHAPRAPSAEAAVISVFSECRRAEAPGGSVIAVRDIESLGAVAALLRSLWLAGAAGPRALLLATSTVPHHELSSDLQALFPLYKQCVYAVREPTASEVVAFLRPPLTEAPLRPPPAAAAPPPPLPRAPPPPPPRESKAEASRRKRKEDYKLRELRIFLRDICRKLASNRRFYKFTKPVDLEEVTDYPEIIKKPMDLETMMTKVDLHQYNCAREFLDDVDLICANALEYNPDRTSSDKQIRHEACSLRDHAHALIDVEMDSDFELECQQLAARRAARAERDDDLPDFIYTAANISVAASCSAAGDAAGAGAGSAGGAAGAGAGGAELAVKRKRRRMNAWSKGLVAKRQRTSHSKSFTNKEPTITDEESKENQPITSTPLPNGDAHSSHDSGSDDDDAPLRPRPDERSGERGGERGGDVRVLGSPAKPTDKAVSRSSPKKRNSRHDSSAGDTVTVQINQSELENLLYKNVKALRTIGLAALLDLHAQLSAALQRYAGASDRARLPHDYQELITRYVQQLAKK